MKIRLRTSMMNGSKNAISISEEKIAVIGLRSKHVSNEIVVKQLSATMTKYLSQKKDIIRVIVIEKLITDLSVDSTQAFVGEQRVLNTKLGTQ